LRRRSSAPSPGEERPAGRVDVVTAPREGQRHETDFVAHGGVGSIFGAGGFSSGASRRTLRRRCATAARLSRRRCFTATPRRQGAYNGPAPILAKTAMPFEGFKMQLRNPSNDWPAIPSRSCRQGDRGHLRVRAGLPGRVTKDIAILKD